MHARVLNLRNNGTTLYNPLFQFQKFLTSKEVHRISASDLANVGCNDGTGGAPCVVILGGGPGVPNNFLFLQYPTNKAFIKNPNIEVKE